MAVNKTPSINRSIHEFPPELLTFCEMLGNFLPEDFFEKDQQNNIRHEYQMSHVLNAADQVLKPPVNYIMVNADMSFREFFQPEAVSS